AIVLDTTALGRGVESPALAAAEGRVAVPDVADGGGLDALAFFLHFEDDVDVLLASSADAEEADADPVSCSPNPALAGRGQRQGGGADGGGSHEITAVEFLRGHLVQPPTGPVDGLLKNLR